MRVRSFLIGMLLLCVMVAVPSCGKKKGTSGITDKEIVVGITTPLSGPAALWGNTGLGAKAWADYVNSKGGVNGRKIRVILKDDGYQPKRALANLKAMKGKVVAVVGLLGTAIVQTCRDFFPKNKVILANGFGNTRMWTGWPKDKMKYIFIAYPDYEDEAEWMAQYAAKNLGGKKFAVFYQNDDYGKLGLAGVEKAVKNIKGAKLVAKVSYELKERALSTHALKIKESGADTLVFYTGPLHAIIMVKTLKKIGYKPKILASFPMGDPAFFSPKMAGKDWEGVYAAIVAQSGMPGFDPAADKVAAILKKMNPKIFSPSFAVFGATSMMHFIEAVKNAGKDVTVESIIKGYESIKNWKAEGMGAPVTYSPNRRHGLNGVRLGLASKGKLKPITDFAIFKPHF